MTTPQEEDAVGEISTTKDARVTYQILSDEEPTERAYIIPDSEYLRAYEKIHPGSAERILRMVEDERILERKNERRYFRTLAIFSCALLVIFVVGIVLVEVFNTHSKSSTFLSVSTSLLGGLAGCIVGLVISTTFVRKKLADVYRQEHEREETRQ